MNQSVSVNIHVHARSEIHETTLSHKKIEPKRGIYEEFAHVFFLTSGNALLDAAGQQIEMQADSIAYIPVSGSFSVAIEAGSTGYLLGVSQYLLIELLGSSAESVLLREFSERSTYLDAPDRHFIEEFHNLAQGFINELSDDKRGSRMAIASYFSLILMGLWRVSGSQESADQGVGEIKTLLQSFRHLVEIHYRERWTIQQYAAALLVSHDRLHSICTRTLSKTPSQLVQERVIFEAKLRLERSGSSIQQLAHNLGFSDATTFSHYFKRYSGSTPAAFRRMIKKPHLVSADSLSFGHADWP
ncbi:helix-turn-helix transcriptional regulator [Marinomonas pollencensis]|uniref:AraC-like DNA-binding protein n=1 Tax=Marinomonas pollencensis TaxID=491954 RepID=A0A3E0DGV7_9GAMM|nr:AraC family transcriptional regulator [Marinomonas pollencensis]REG81938.1 AraC-like DNA-binding protein [Marinomonas pollencensis]